MMKRSYLLVLTGVIFLILCLGKNILNQKEVPTSADFAVNVKDYGAVGDGVHDDTKAFQTAIDDVKSKGGGTVRVSAGIYRLQPIFLKENVHLLGENRNKSILKLSDDAPDDYTRLITTANNTSIQSLTCDGNYQHHPNGIEHMHCIFVYDHENVVIQDNIIVNAVGDGISVSGSSKTSKNITITNNIVKENQRSQIVIEQVNHIRIKNNLLLSNTGRPGLHFEPWEKQQFEDAVISGNTIESNVNGYCVLLAGSDSELANKRDSGYFYKDIQFNQNKVDCPNGALLLMDTKDSNVYDNYLRVSEVHVWRKNEHVKIKDNTIIAVNGIRIEGGKNGELIANGTNISGNHIYSSNDGVNIHAGASNTMIKSNMFIGSKQASGVALFASDNITNTVISKNTFQQYRWGVFLDYDYYSDAFIHGVTITHNHFQNKKSAISQPTLNTKRITNVVIANNQLN